MPSSDSIKRLRTVAGENGDRHQKTPAEELGAGSAKTQDEEAYFDEMVQLLAEMSPERREFLLDIAEKMANAKKLVM